MVTLGLLYPGHSAEDDYPAAERRLADQIGDAAPRLVVEHTSVGEDAHRVDALLDLGGRDRLTAGAQALLERAEVDALMWACTSGSFVFGVDGAAQQAADLTEATGLPASSTSFGFVHACEALGVHKVAVAASYPEPVAQRFREFLADSGIEVTALGSHGIVTAAEVGTLDAAQVAAVATSVDATDADAVLIPDTAMHTLAYLEHLEEQVGKAVLTANQVTLFEGLRLLGEVPRLPGLGSLFQTERVAVRG